MPIPKADRQERSSDLNLDPSMTDSIPKRSHSGGRTRYRSRSDDDHPPHPKSSQNGSFRARSRSLGSRPSAAAGDAFSTSKAQSFRKPLSKPNKGRRVSLIPEDAEPENRVATLTEALPVRKQGFIDVEGKLKIEPEPYPEPRRRSKSDSGSRKSSREQIEDLWNTKTTVSKERNGMKNPTNPPIRKVNKHLMAGKRARVVPIDMRPEKPQEKHKKPSKKKWRSALWDFIQHGPGSGRVYAVPPAASAASEPPPNLHQSEARRAVVAASTSRERRGDEGEEDNDMVVTKDIQAEKAFSAGPEPKVYAKRWAILVMFMLLSGSNGAQWIEYSIIAPTIVEFYGVSYPMVDWTSMIYMLTYIFFFIPAAWLLDKYGLRVSILLGAAGNCIGAWIKLLSTDPNSFWITFIGQTIVGASQMFTLGIPPRLAAVWFGPNEVSTACAAGVFGNQLGIAIGFVTPPLLVHMGTKDAIAWDLTVLFLCSAVLNTFIFVVIILFFSSRPLVPPSLAQLTAQEEKAFDSNFWSTLAKLMTGRDFLLLFVTYGINTGVFYAVSTLLSQMVLHFYPTAEQTVGQIGLVIVLAGMLGSVAGGFVLDKYKQFKMTTLLVYFFSFLGMLSFTFTIDLDSIAIVFVNAFLLGFFMTGYLPIGFEFAAEITYPAAEGTTSGLLNASAQIFGIFLTLGMGKVMELFGVFWCNVCMSAILIVGTFLTALIKEEQKRQQAHAAHAMLPTSETQLTSYTTVTD